MRPSFLITRSFRNSPPRIGCSAISVMASRALHADDLVLEQAARAVAVHPDRRVVEHARRGARALVGRFEVGDDALGVHAIRLELRRALDQIERASSRSVARRPATASTSACTSASAVAGGVGRRRRGRAAAPRPSGSFSMAASSFFQVSLSLPARTITSETRSTMSLRSGRRLPRRLSSASAAA